nr:RES family NAD+ phosphorylase [uncultured Enterobacter sp.]
MAKRPVRAKGVPEQPEQEEAGTTPLPQPGPLKTTTLSVSAGTVLHRVHQEQCAADQFNPGVKGNARFSPIRNAEGGTIPTLYAGLTRECAMMETVFHDVPFAPGLKTYDKSKLDGQLHSTLMVTDDLELLDLTSISLRKLGITRKQLIDTEKDQYPNTRKWAEALHQQCPTAQGLSWVSRQDDTTRAMVLFGTRVSVQALRPTGESLSLVNDTATYDAVLDLAERLDVLIVPGKD